MSDLLNKSLTALFGLLFFPFRALPPIWGMIFISLLAGLLMLWIFGKVSNQTAIKIIRDRIRGNLIGVRLFQHDALVIFRLQGRLLVDTLVYMKYSLVPMAITIVPVIFIMIQLNLRFEARPLEPGERAIVKAHVRDAESLRGPISLETPDGIEVETPPLRIASEREIAWRIRADEPGDYLLKITVGDEVMEKKLAVGGRWREVPTLRTGKSLIDELLYPGESTISASSTFESISVNYPKLQMPLFGLNIHWLIWFFVLSIAFGFLFKGALGVEI